jgi:hypothetical protein
MCGLMFKAGPSGQPQTVNNPSVHPSDGILCSKEYEYSYKQKCKFINIILKKQGARQFVLYDFTYVQK